MKPIVRISYLSVLLVVTLLAGCGGNNPSACSFCYSVATSVTVNGLNKPDGGVTVSGSVAVPQFDEQIDCDLNPAGVTSIGGTTDANGILTRTNAAMGHNCAWSFFRGTSSLCPAANVINATVDQPGRQVPLPCGVQVNTFLAAPNDIHPDVPPATMTITGQNMVPTYAMPQVYFYDGNQVSHLQVTAISASADGTSIVIPSSQVTFPAGYYGAVVYVMQSDGTWNPVGGAGIFMEPPPSTGTDPPPCSPHQDCGA